MAVLNHIVSQNDTLERLSRMYRVPVCMILRANEGQKNLLRPDRRIAIPFPNFCLEKAQSRASIFEKNRYRVQAGDTLFGIAQRFGTTMQAIMKENKIARPEELRPGREIVVSCPKEGFVVYSLKSTDTLEDVALKFDVSERALWRYNDIACGAYPGMQLIIPLGEK